MSKPTLRQAAQAAYDHAASDPLARLDQPQLTALRKALDAPDIADELATALRDLSFAVDSPRADLEAANEHARKLLSRYDAQSTAASPRV